MENKNSLFRKEAMDNRLNRSLGAVSINAPLNIKLITSILLLLTILFLAFAALVPFSEKKKVRGFIDSEQGINSIYSTNNGLIISSYIKEGLHIHKNQNLMVISDEHQSFNDKNVKQIEINLNKQRLNCISELKIKSDFSNSLNNLYKKHFVSTQNINGLKSEILELENKIKAIDSEVIFLKQKQIYTIKSSVDGVITNVQYKKGQFVDTKKLLFQIIPDDSRLIARLYIPAKDIEFINKNSLAFLKYDSYPAGRFGTHQANIQEINLTVLNDINEDKPLSIGQAYYKATAKIQHSYVKVYGQKLFLKHGMTFTAIIPGQKKTLLNWVLDPIYSFVGERLV